MVSVMIVLSDYVIPRVKLRLVNIYCFKYEYRFVHDSLFYVNDVFLLVMVYKWFLTISVASVVLVPWFICQVFL